MSRTPRPTTMRAAVRGLLYSVLAFLSFVPAAQALDDYVLGSIMNGFMPDFDQQRQAGPMVFDGMSFQPLPPGLPNNGNMYCVPTASIDVMAYLANHGYPNALPGGPVEWQSQDMYDVVTAAIFDMGTLMETDPEDGTLGKGRSGTQEWLDTHVGPDVFIVDSQYATLSYGPNMWEVANAGHSGQIVIVNVGWFEQVASSSWIRRGGHQVVLTGAYENDGFFLDGCEIRFRNPGSGGDSQTQSTFSNTTRTMDYRSGQFSSSSDPVQYYNRTMAQLVGYNSGSNKGFLNGYYTVTPVFGLAANGVQLDIMNPHPIEPGPFPLTQSYPAEAGSSIADFAIHPLKTCVFYTVRDAAGSILPQVYCLDRVSGESTVALTASNPEALAFGGAQRLFLLEGSCVNGYDLNPSPTLIGTQCPTTTPLDAIAVDDVHDRVFAISAAQGQLFVMDEDLETSVAVALPTVVQLSGAISMTTHPTDGTIWVKGANSPTAYHLEYAPGTFDPTTGGSSPSVSVIDSFFDIDYVGATGIDCNSSNHVFWVKDGTVREHAQNASGGWEEVTDSPFAGMAAGNKICLARAAENTTLEYRTDPSHVNILPDPEDSLFQRGDCNGDLNFDIADAIATLSFLFSGAADPDCMDACDSNDDGTVDIGDGIFTLSALFSGGMTPPAPYTDCGDDPTPDGLDCQAYSCP